MSLRRLAVAFALLCLTALPAAAAPEGQMTWAVHVTLAARWLDPGDNEGAITPFMFFFQRILADRVVFAPIWENAFIRAIGPRVEESGLNLISAYPYSAPYEDVKLKRR